MPSTLASTIETLITMSSIPSRTRSLRKPSVSGTKIDRSNASESSESHPPLRSGRTSQSPSRLPVKPLPPTRLTRSTSTSVARRPPSATGSTISSNGSMGPPPPRANVSRPASGGLTRSSSIKKTAPLANPELDPVKKDRSRPPIVTSRHIRNTSATSFATGSKPPTGHARTRSSSTLLSSSTALQPPTRNGADLAKPHPAQAEPQLRKPTFNTLQQHYSPAKNLAPKPHPVAFLAPPSPSKLPSNIAISAETAKLQSELLQLHLLHRDARIVDKEWRASAKRKLGARFQSVVDRNDELVHSEVEETGKINAVALKKWQDVGAPGWGLDEKIQVLDEVVTGVWNLGDSGGKYGRVVRRFERWLSRCQSILSSRNEGDGLENGEVIFLEELDHSWKDDCLLIGRKLDTWRSHLKDLGVPDHGSSLATVVSGYRSLVEGMLTELGVMAQIERDAMAMEREWIKNMNDDGMDDDMDTPTAGAIWRSR